MKYTMQSILFTGLFFFNLVNANNNRIEFAKNEVFIPERLGNLKLYKDYYGFHIRKDGETYDIPNCFCDSLLQRMSNEQLVNFLGRNKPQIIILTPEEFAQVNKDVFVEITEDEMVNLLSQLFGSGYISINQMDDGEYILRAKIRLLGGVGEELGKALKDGAVVAGTVAGAGIGGAAIAGGVISGATVFAGSAGEAVAAVWAGGALLGETGSGIAISLGAGAHTFAALGGAAAAASTVVVPVTIIAGVVYLGYLGIRWLTRPTEEPVANPPAPNEEVALQSMPAARIRILPKVQ